MKLENDSAEFNMVSKLKAAIKEQMAETIHASQKNKSSIDDEPTPHHLSPKEHYENYGNVFQILDDAPKSKKAYINTI